MKRNQKFLTALLAAALTFGGLYVLAGQKYFASMGGRNCHYAERRRHLQEQGWHLDGERPAVKPDIEKAR